MQNVLPDAPEHAWYIACRSRDLSKKPRAVQILGRRLVLFRGTNNKVSALEDRCPHRNAPLSLGRIHEGGIQCAYHGWVVAADGSVKEIPALENQPPNHTSGNHAYATREAQNYVWVYMAPGVQPTTEPFQFTDILDSQYAVFEYSAKVPAHFFNVLENMLDVPHTSFLHRGLFRGRRRSQLEVEIRRRTNFVEARYVGEPPPSGFVGRLLGVEGQVVEHTDRYCHPTIAQVEYRQGPSRRILITNAVTPRDAHSSEYFSIVSFRLPVPAWLVKTLLYPVIRVILMQDSRILQKQTETIEAFGGIKFTHTHADILGPEILRLLKHAEFSSSKGEDQDGERVVRRTIQVY